MAGASGRGKRVGRRIRDGRVEDLVAVAVADFGRAVAEKLGRGGHDEDQLRGPVEILLGRLSVCIGVDAVAYGEVDLKDIRARPDYAVDVGNSRVGYIELKAPGRNVPPNWKPDSRERRQWERMSALPNVVYSDGVNWGRYSYGVQQGPIVRLGGSLTNEREPLHPVDHEFEILIRDFLIWDPDPPRTLTELIRIVAGLCRLLRDEVSAILEAAPHHAAYEDLSLLADDWRDLLFPGLDDGTFSDAYAQTITFAMLLARVNGINFDSVPLHEIARQLGKKHSLIGKSFAVLTDSDATEELRVIETLRRVIGVVNWERLDDSADSDDPSNNHDRTNIYIELYEQFLAEYDPKLRRKSGSYYTPEPVARFMVNFVNEILRTQLKRSWGFAADDVIVIDPAMGTGTFLVEIVRAVAETVDEKQGAGARPARLRELFQKRLVGFERQVAPYAVAELRLHQALKAQFDTDIPPTEMRFLTDALEDPRAQQGRLRAAHKIIQRSRAEANRIKREARVMVIIGNPPHVENARGYALWIEDPRKAGPPPDTDELERPSLDEFRANGYGRYESDLYALHWYFWRWALWKVFDAHLDDPTGVVAFVTPSSYIRGKAFAGMRRYLRRTCDEGWIIDVSPEGNRSDINTRIFGDVQRQLCIGVFVRYGAGDKKSLAAVHYVSVGGTREEKFNDLQSIHLADSRWENCRQDSPYDPFLPGGGMRWDSYPQLSDLMPWTSRGVTTGRTWVYAPDRDTLGRRWRVFIRADTEYRRLLFKEARDRKINSVVSPLPGFRSNSRTLAEERGDMLDPVRVGYRSFDRQWVIPDHRLMVVARPPLWAVRSEKQIFVTEQSSHPIDKGPGITFTSNIPDIHHYNARSGRVIPLYRDAGASANFAPSLIRVLADKLRVNVSSEDVLAYVAAIVAHSGYTARFRYELQRPGVRVPLTASRRLWSRAVQLGRAVIWLHTYGERYIDESADRPRGVMELVEQTGPRVIRPIPDTRHDMPVDFEYDPENETLRVGAGLVGPVRPAVFEYEVTGLRVVRKWLDYRLMQPRHKKNTSPLDDINCACWSRHFTDELLELVTVLENCLRLESQQSALLDEIVKASTISEKDLETAGVLPAPLAMTKPPRIEDLDRLPLFPVD
jgi:hypothetical protein